MKSAKQTTLRDQIAVSGIGVHSGLPVTLTLHPADAGTGIRYRPMLNDNVIITIGFNELIPFAGFRQIYPGRSLRAVFTSVRFQY